MWDGVCPRQAVCKERKCMEPKKLDRKKLAATCLILVAGILVCVVLYLIWQYPHMKEFGSSGNFASEEVRKKAEELVGLFSEERYQEILDEYAGKELLRAADARDLENMSITASANRGGFQEISDMVLAEMKKAGRLYAVAEVRAVYEQVTLTYTFSFNERMELAGVYIKSPRMAK